MGGTSGKDPSLRRKTVRLFSVYDHPYTVLLRGRKRLQERLLLIMDQLGVQVEKPLRYEIMVLGLGDAGKRKAFSLVQQLRALGIAADSDHVGRSVKAGMKFADKVGAANVLVLGDNEIAEGKATLKNMQTGGQVETALDPEEIAKHLRG